MTTTTSTDVKLSDAVRALVLWVDEVPPHARAQVAARIDALALLLGQLVADCHEEVGS